MRGFLFENHTTVKVQSGTGPILLGHLDLEPGAYLVWGKLSVGVNGISGYPPPPWPDATGAAFLALGAADDMAFYGVKPASAENNGNISLMCAATITRGRRARLYLQNLYPLPVFCNFAKVMALQVETLTEREIGEDRQDAPEDAEERLRDAIIKAKLSDRVHTYLATVRED